MDSAPRSQGETDGDESPQLSWLQALPYPWTSNNGLTTVLRDSDLWSDALCHELVRKSVKYAAKAALAVRGVAHTDLKTMGQLAVRLLSTRRSRTLLFRELERSRPALPDTALASELQQAIRRRSERTLPESLYRWHSKRYFLNIEHFRKWIVDGDGMSWTARELLLATAPFAMVQPNEAAQLARVLVNRAEVREMLRSDTADVPINTPNVAPPGTQSPLVVDDASRDSSPSAVRPTQQLDPRLRELADTLDKACEANQRALSALATGDLARGVEESKTALEVSAAARVSYAELLTREDLPAATLPGEIPNSALADRAGANTWLRELNDQLEAVTAYSRAAVRRHRDSLATDLARVGLPLPPDWDTATTLELIAAMRARESDRIRVEDAWRQLVNHGDISVLRTLPDPGRTSVALRLLDSRAQPELALRLFVEDDQIQKTYDLERLVPLVADTLVADDSIPLGFWSALHRRTEDTFCEVLDAHGIGDFLADVPESRIRADELFSVLRAVPREVSPQLSSWYAERRIELMSVPDRVEALAELVASTKKQRWIPKLVKSLLDAERWVDALLVASIADRAGLAEYTNWQALRAPFLGVLVDACQHERRHAVLRSIVVNPSELLTDADSLVVLLYVSSVVDAAQIDTLVYRDPDLYEAARKRYPVLVEEWLLKIRAGLISSESVKLSEKLFSNARLAFAEWRHELSRKSVYSNWAYAADYQRHINDWLTSAFDKLCATWRIEDCDDPEDVIEELHLRHELPPVEGAARRNMLSYLEAQLRRLHTFGELAAANVDIGKLLSEDDNTLHGMLTGEARSASRVVGRIYAIAIEDQSP